MTIDPDSGDAPTMFRAPPPGPPAPSPAAPPPPTESTPRVETSTEPEKKPFVPRRRSDAYQKAVEKPKTEAPAAPKPKPALPPKQDIGGALYRRKKP